MNKIILTLAAVSTLAAASAASAQPGRFDDGGRRGFAEPGAGVAARQAMLAQRIDMGVRNGSLTRLEASRLRMQLNQIQRLEDQFRRTRPGLTGREIAQLDERLDRLSIQVRFERHDRDDRRYGYGYGDRRY